MSFDIEKINSNKEKILENIVNIFSKEFALTPIVGIELEFYLLDQHKNPISEGEKSSAIISDIYNLCLAHNIEINSINKEKGKGQYELRTNPFRDIVHLSHNIECIRGIIKEVAKEHGEMIAAFESMPFDNDCGSSLQINLSLLERSNKNVFARDKTASDNITESPIMLFAIGGLCKLMHESMPFFLPDDSDYIRCNRTKNLELFTKGFYPAPVNISWGNNNRTTAIRIPDSFTLSSNMSEFISKNLIIREYPLEIDRRIEHRVPSANADPYMAIANVLFGVHYGIANSISPPNKIYGNAFDLQYQLTDFAGNLNQAISDFESGSIVKSYIDELQ